MQAAVERLLSTPGVQGPGVGALGFGLGGGLAVCAAASCPQVAATVTYYCILPRGNPDFTQITGPILGHFGTADIFISLKEAKALEMDIRTAGVNVEFDKLAIHLAPPTLVLCRGKPSGGLASGEEGCVGVWVGGERSFDEAVEEQAAVA